MDAEGALAKLDQRLRVYLDADRTRAAAEAAQAGVIAEPYVTEPIEPQPLDERPSVVPIEEAPPEPVNDPEAEPVPTKSRLYADQVASTIRPSSPVAPAHESGHTGSPISQTSGCRSNRDGSTTRPIDGR